MIKIRPIQTLMGFLAITGVAALALFAVSAEHTEAKAPTCSGTLGIAVHGHHIVADYVTGIGHANMDWPPSGGVVGDAVSENGGVAIAGGPGPGFHFLNGIAPGASFCLLQSNSPGAHPGP